MSMPSTLNRFLYNCLTPTKVSDESMHFGSFVDLLMSPPSNRFLLWNTVVLPHAGNMDCSIYHSVMSWSWLLSLRCFKGLQYIMMTIMLSPLSAPEAGESLVSRSEGALYPEAFEHWTFMTRDFWINFSKQIEKGLFFWVENKSKKGMDLLLEKLAWRFGDKVECKLKNATTK